MKVLVTGANGFVGKAIVLNLSTHENTKVRAAVRSQSGQFPASIEVYDHLDLENSDWSYALQDIDVVIHCAARVHVMKDTSKNPLLDFRKANVDGTLRLATQAASSGVKRFIYLSSLKVNGENTKVGQAFTAEDSAAPLDPYGISKFEAETGLLALAKQSTLEVVIIRPALVYGPGVKANFLSMMRWLNKSIPLPLGWTENKRSFVAIENLVDLIKTCCFHPAAKNQVFMVSDGHDLSTTQLLRLMAQALNKTTYLIPVPPMLIRGLALACGKAALSQRLLGSLQVDISKNKALLNWTPPVKVETALKATAEHFLKQSSV